MANEQNRKELLDSLVDIRDVKIDRSQPVEERMKSYVEQIKNPYLFKVGRAYRIPKAHLFTYLCIGCGEAVTA